MYLFIYFKKGVLIIFSVFYICGGMAAGFKSLKKERKKGGEGRGKSLPPSLQTHAVLISTSPPGPVNLTGQLCFCICFSFFSTFVCFQLRTLSATRSSLSCAACPQRHPRRSKMCSRSSTRTTAATSSTLSSSA